MDANFCIPRGYHLVIAVSLMIGYNIPICNVINDFLTINDFQGLLSHSAAFSVL